MKFRTPAAAGLLALVLFAGACGDDGGSAADASSDADATEGTEGGPRALTGVLEIAAGVCDGSTSSGSYFRMVQPGGTPEAGPFIDNPDSTCVDKTTTAIGPGVDGGLRVGGDYQAQPEPNFLEDGTSTADAVITPQAFFAVPFGVSTNAVDPQTQAEVPAPTATVDGGSLVVDHRAFSVSWNGQYFNQGAPAPDGSGAPASGTYDPATGAYTLDWITTVAGGPFDGFSGVWHLEGTFQEG